MSPLVEEIAGLAGFLVRKVIDRNGEYHPSGLYI
jgi:hypothetical protein